MFTRSYFLLLTSINTVEVIRTEAMEIAMVALLSKLEAVIADWFGST